jgi:hypothetical protein
VGEGLVWRFLRKPLPRRSRYCPRPYLTAMDIKYLSDPKGNITGVFIALEEWERLKKQYGIVEGAPAETGAKLQKGLSDALKKAGLDEAGNE